MGTQRSTGQGYSYDILGSDSGATVMQGDLEEWGALPTIRGVGRSCRALWSARGKELRGCSSL